MSGNVRLLFYGGSKTAGDNWAFSFAAKTVIRDYKKYYPQDMIIERFVDSAKTIVDTINEQKEGKVISLDIFSHGNPKGLYLYKGAPLNAKNNFEGEDIAANDLNAGLYAGYIRMWRGDDEHDEIRNVSQIDFSRFRQRDAIIEIHGCKTGKDPDWPTDSISKNLSEELPDGYVIAHIESANPSVRGEKKTKNEEQDYRFGTRVIWKNGVVIKETEKKGMLRVSDF
ncbi:hypothetical protein JT93_004560 [Salmonella enterica]|nr:hypothetical protein [Salmonella enterica]EDX3117398.1 hypothetical protein [Salmonella enterica subsp. enterica serovar Mississippi]